MLLIMHACGAGAAVPSNTRFTVIHRGGARMECGARTCTRRRGLDEVRRCFRRGLNRPGNGTQLARWKRFNKLRLKGQDPPFFTVSPATNHSPVVFFSVAVFISSGIPHTQPFLLSTRLYLVGSPSSLTHDHDARWGHAAGHQRDIIAIIKDASAPSPVHKVIHACRQHLWDADSMSGIDTSHARKGFGRAANSVLTASRSLVSSCKKRVLPAWLACDAGKCLKFQVWSCRIRA